MSQTKAQLITSISGGVGNGTAAAPALTGDDTDTGISFGTNTVTTSVNGAAATTVDSSGRLLVGTSSARSAYTGLLTPRLQLEGTSAETSHLMVTRNENTATPSGLVLAKSRGTSTGSNVIVQNGDAVGVVGFEGSDGVDTVRLAEIAGYVDGTPGANDMPGRLVFSTTADGASSPTERLFITSAGRIGSIRNPDDTWPSAVSSSGQNCAAFGADGVLSTSSNAPTCIYVNRNDADGDLIRFYSTGSQEGVISVAGTTVTYGGGHLARWSQLPNNEDPSSILKGTVMSNLDEMCDWGEEENEQLNKTKISDVEGDKNVAGVFVATSFTDDGPLDYFLAMTGDMVIRIAEGVTVERGDLLMSAGDGTAKPQDDDIIRSKTIAKVTSNNVSCTYDDGSYCVPCVLMAC